jgi:hypothetical protein
MSANVFMAIFLAPELAWRRMKQPEVGSRGGRSSPQRADRFELNAERIPAYKGSKREHPVA